MRRQLKLCGVGETKKSMEIITKGPIIFKVIIRSLITSSKTKDPGER